MKRALVLMAILVLMSLLVFGCTRNNYQYPTGYAAYGQQPQQVPQQQGYAPGCIVAGPDATPIDVSEPVAAA